MHSSARGRSPLQTVSPRWILTAIAITLAGAALCVWGALCLTFWLGSWQLLYHPKAKLAATPDRAGLACQSVDFAPSDAGRPQLHGWWLPAADARFTAIHLHGADQNLGDTIPTLQQLHDSNLNVFAFDYRGYGTSAFERPSESHWRQDTDWAIAYLRDTRHIAPGSMIVVGSGLGANLALEVAAAHPELAGVALEDPLTSPANLIFHDPRAQLVPARLLNRDRWDIGSAAAHLQIPSLWLVQKEMQSSPPGDGAYERVTARKTRVWIQGDANHVEVSTMNRWLDDLGSRR